MTRRENSSGPGASDGGNRSRAGTERKPRVRLDPRTFYDTPPRELLHRFVDGDPLDLDLRCETRRDEVSYLISRERLFLKSAARCAHSGFSYRGTPPVDEWIAGCIDESIRDILDEDEVGALKDLPIEEDFHYEMLSEAVGFTPRVSRAAHVAFNALPEEPRAAYFAISVHDRTVEQYAAAGGGPPELIKRNLVQAVSVLIQFLPSPDTGEVN